MGVIYQGVTRVSYPMLSYKYYRLVHGVVQFGMISSGRSKSRAIMLKLRGQKSIRATLHPPAS